MHHFVPLPQEGATPATAIAPEHTAAIKRWTREYLKLPENSVVSVNEFACGDPGCPLLETVIVVFEESRSRGWKMTRPRVAVTKMMVHQTLATAPTLKTNP